MSAATYSVEPAKSSRSSCKKCKLKIEKEDLRIGTSRLTQDDIMMVSWNHATCFVLPKKQDVDQFFSNLQVSEDVSEAQLTSLKEALSGSDADTPGKKRTSSESGGGGGKKAKGGADVTAKMSEAELELYERYKSMTLDQLKDFMRWNRQPIAGTKPELISRCMDGETLGALPGCPEVGCKGKLKLEGGKVSCAGAYSDDVGTFVRCYYSASVTAITRLPWRKVKPTEEEVLAATTFQSTINASAAKGLFDGLDMTQLADKRTAVNRFLAVARAEGIDVGADDNDAKIKIGTLVMGNSSLSPEDLLTLAESSYGTIRAARAKVAGSSTGTVCEGNEGIVIALSQLSQSYFKAGNANAGNTYKKAAAAIRACPELILSGKRVSKGKNKLDGIGVKCGEYIDEFLATGAIAKIDEKNF